jgi:hypothetical protein
LVVNHTHPQTAGALKIYWPIIDEYALLRRPLRDLESDAKDRFFGFTRTHIAGATEDRKLSAQMKSLDAVLVQLQGLIVDGTDEILAGACGVSQHRARIRIFFRLRKHEGGKVFAAKRSGAIEKRSVEILVQRDLAAIEGRKSEVVPVLKFFVIELECRGGFKT